MIVRKCCFCCSLKYGFYTWAVINLLFRFISAFALYFGQHATVFSDTRTSFITLASMSGGACGWQVGSILILIIALKGIVEKRYMLIYPYIVVLVIEIIVLLFFSVYLSIVQTPWHVLEFLLILVVNGYTIICLISLYQFTKQEQKSLRQVEAIPFKNV